MRKDFALRSIQGFLDHLEYTLSAEDLAKRAGWAQAIDPRVKVAALAVLVISVVAAHRLAVIAALFALGVAVAVASHVPIRNLATRVWFAVLLFTGSIALPAIFLTPGRVLYTVPLLHCVITAQGLTSASFLLARAETTATFSLLLVLTTPWIHVLKSLRAFGVPVVLVVILGMTYRYIFVLLRTAHDMFESRRSRMLGRLHAGERRRIAVNSAGVLLSKAFQLSGEVYLAMQSRGFRGEVYLLSDFTMRPVDWAVLPVLLLLSATAVWFGR
ncbi:MAG: cobalt ECF transporter T component CbiQ [Acidobacteriota bacterium]|nr:cobalt ECF transporter T component CbiQ [Acidobacteriota bacterium]